MQAPGLCVPFGLISLQFADWEGLQPAPSAMEAFASLCGRTAFAVPEAKSFSVLRGSERWALQESVLGDAVQPG